jgi:hypothetical protein
MRARRGDKRRAVVYRSHLAWINDLRVQDLGSWRKACRRNAIAAHSMKHCLAPSEQVICDDPPMAAPPNSFSAHDRASACRTEFEQFGERVRKRGRERVVSVIVETVILPECIYGRRNVGRPRP